MSLLDGLTSAQAEAVTHVDGPMLVIAGAGSGKTRVLTRRIAYLVDQGVPPWSILAITFTNKAAHEMKDRVTELVGPSVRSMWISTFHSACLRILREHAEALGYSKSFVIYDQADARRLCELVVRDLGLDVKRFTGRAMVSAISQAKSQGLSPEDFAASAHGMYNQKVAEVYAAYQLRLSAANAMDFDDILSKAVSLLELHPAVRAHYTDRFRYILVDEFQDTNMVQNSLIRQLAGDRKNVFVVGDSDQSIYRFRGAHLGNILEFEENFPGAKTIALEENFRSTQSILDVANAVIDHNPRRHATKLFSDRGSGEPVVLYAAPDDRDEAAYVASEIVNACAQGDRSYGDFAVFFRTNAQSRLLEEQLRLRGVPFRVVGAVPFFERKEVKDVLAYLKLATNPNDEIALRRVINTPKRGIGDTTLMKLFLAGALPSETLLGSIGRNASAVATKRIANAAEGFVELMGLLQDGLVSDPRPQHAIELALRLTHYRESLGDESEFETISRNENLDELLRFANDYQTVQELLEGSALYSGTDEITEDSAVTLMTLHMAKGLEFKVVYLVGLEDGIFPHMRSLTDPSELEEERRLLYVGITRAMERLTLSYANQRLGFGEMSYNPPSRFLRELPQGSIIEQGEVHRASSEYSSFGVRSGWSEQEPSRGEFQWPVRSSRATNSSAPRANLRMGQRVFHDKWGEGVVLELGGPAGREEIVVRFEEVGTKRLVLALANLKPLE